MKVFISFNWPVGSSPLSFRASMGLMNKSEEVLTFNIGIIESSTPSVVKWLSSKPKDIAIAESNNFYIQGEQCDKIVVESYGEDGTVKKRAIVDTNKEWPAEANGAATVEWSRFY